MILSPIAPDDLPAVLAAFAARLRDDPLAEAAFARIRAGDIATEADDTPEWRAAAVALARAYGIPTLDEEPAVAFSWDGTVLRTLSEPWVIVHEVAHWLLCPPARRPLPDFGVGAGPESGRKAEADAVRVVDDDAQQQDEALSSLLGILLLAEIGAPALPAFLEQNWLEGHERPDAVAHFCRTARGLFGRRLIDETARPLRPPVR
ncbi:MAG: hypothetical protein EXQ85_06295 [Alphaproteobacteria bacterium]|nr:hypothetical protein [Alphaproteobacteria bacterium]